MYSRAKVFAPPTGYFKFKIESDPVYNLFNILPLDSRRDCKSYPSASINFNQNHFYPDNFETEIEERHGNISLNLLIQKNISTPNDRWQHTPINSNTNIIILSGVTFAVDKGQPGNATTNTEFLLKNYSDGTGTKFILNGNNEEFSGATLKLKHSDVYETNARMRFQQDCELILKPQSNTILEKYGNLIFENGGEMYMEQNSNLTFYDHGEIIINSGGKVYNCGANITNNSNVCIIAHQGGQYYVGSQYCNSNISHTFNNGAFLVINGGDLFVADNSKLIFDGSNSFLNAKPNSKIYLGQNAKFEFKNGAYLKADNVVFNSPNNEHWEGLIFENAGSQTEIKNCTFTNAKNPIKIINDSASAYLDKKIIGNTFNMPAVTGNCIYAQNVFKVLIQNNYFNMSGTSLNQFGIYIRNNYNAGYPNQEAPTPLYQLNILSNSFSSGTIGMALMNTAGIMIPFYVFDNRFIGSSNSYYGIIGRKITGDIKNTKFINTNINQGIRLDLCDVNLYNNEVKSNYESVRYNGVSTITMAPTINGINYNWKGGRNKLNSKYASNLMVDYSSLPKLDYGDNCFELQTTSTGSHLVGTSSISPDNPYNCRNNGWTYISGVQLSNVTYNSNIILPYLTPIISCGNTPVFDSYSYTDKGFGIYDTVGVSEREDTTTIPEDEALFAQANYYYEESDFTSAIVSFKNLIDNNESSNELPEAVWTMYSCYSQLDTSNSETYRDDLYSECKLYLTDKINSNNYQNEFVDVAYQVILMCEANIGNYNHAMDGYEFIINFHPDPVIRINASWDYEDLESLLGQGGAERTKEQIEQTEEENKSKKIKKLLRKINNDPIKQKLLKIYDKKVTEEYNLLTKGMIDSKDSKENNINKNISVNDRKKIEQKLYTQIEQKIIQKSIENVMKAGRKTEEEKQRDIAEDFIMSSGMEIQTDNNISGEIIPNEYKLNQNYPNPFNPITNILYQLPKDGFVKLKVFDLLGREITTLVNEIKKPGSYEVSFNGDNLASGIYFYRLEVYYENGDKNFIDTKRMVLVKQIYYIKE